MSRAQLTSTVEQNTGGAVAPFVAGKNVIINGGMDIFQRTSFATFNAYALDRWYINSSQNVTVTQSTAKVTPNSQYMMLMIASGTQQIFVNQAIETLNAIYYAGKTVTLSGYAAGLTTTTNLNMGLQYSTSTDNSVSGTWTGITASSGSPDLTLSGTVTRWSATYAIPSTAKSLRVQIVNNAANITVGQGIYLGDVQLEVGSVATAFSRAGGTIQGELAACQRYYWRSGTGVVYQVYGNGFATSTTNSQMLVKCPVTMRVVPTVLDTANLVIYDGTVILNFYSPVLGGLNSTPDYVYVQASGSSLVANRPYALTTNSSTGGYIGLGAEL
jgi:hypothetical protein